MAEMEMNQAVNGDASRRRNGLEGFVVDALDGGVMREYCRAERLDLVLDVSDEQLGVALMRHFRQTTPKENLARCSICAGISSEFCHHCPFCGDGSEVEAGTPTEEEIEEPTDSGEREVTVDSPGDEVAEEEYEQVEDDEPEEDEDEDQDEDAPGEEQPPEEPEAEAARPEKEDKMETQLVTTQNGTGKHLAKVVTEKDLDRAIDRVQKHKTESLDAYWQVGREILDINTRQLWKQRVGPDGKSRYKTFDAFANIELKMTPQAAYNMMDLARNYSSAAEIRELGKTNAILLLKAPTDARDKIKEKIKHGASTREVTEDVKKARAKHGSPKTSQQAKAGAKSSAVRAKATEKVAVASFEGTRTIKLYKRPESLKNLDLSKLKRAKALTDQPFGRIEHGNGVVQYITVSVKDGELVARIDTRREE